jgi:ribosomal protein L16 Arg81 hydroxylase
MACRLLPGDWLYMPKGYWHLAHAYEHSLSLSIGVFPEALAL